MGSYPFSILLSASVPKEKRSNKYRGTYEKINNAQVQIEEAVICLARNIFQAGGQIVFGGHPSISPLVAMVAAEFEGEQIAEHQTSDAEGPKVSKPITIYQSEAYSNVIPKDTSNMLLTGHAHIIWTEAREDEQYDPKRADERQCLASLTWMREEMTSRPLDAHVCIGGMEGVEEEFDIFREKFTNKPTFLLATTGGATRLLAEAHRESRLVDIPDNLTLDNSPTTKAQEGNEQLFELIPYSYITATIVRKVLQGKR